MAATITISDDFDLEKIRKSGQCFRVIRCDGEGSPIFSVVSKNHYLEMSSSASGADKWKISCSKKEFSDFWVPYFDLDRSYEVIRNQAQCDNAFLNEALDFGCGLRILKQDPWEMIITFIISQRRSMPAIATAVEKICHCFGENNGNFYEFPSAEKFASLNEAELRDCGIGYRAPYVLDAARRVASGDTDLDACASMADDELFSELCKIKGVGTKVANCIMLFGFSRFASAPVDVWIQRVIDKEFAGKNPFPAFGDVAGIIQQYLFFYITQTK